MRGAREEEKREKDEECAGGREAGKEIACMYSGQQFKPSCDWYCMVFVNVL